MVGGVGSPPPWALSSWSGILRWISTRQPWTRTFSTTSRSRRWRASWSSSSSEAATRCANCASPRRRRFWLASSALRSLVASLSLASWSCRVVSGGAAGALAVGGLQGAVEVLELGGDELVLVGRGGGDDGALAGDQLARVEQCRSDPLEDEGVELVGADVALGAAPVVAAGAQDVVVAAVVVAVEGAVAAAHLVAVGADPAVAALDQTAQQPGAGLGAAGVPLGVVAAHLLGALEGGLVDDRGHRDRDPLLAGALAVAGLARARAAGTVAVDRFAAVVVDGADVGLVAQQATDRRDAPDRLAGRRGDRAVVQVVGDLAHRPLVLDVGAEDLAHDPGLGFEDLHPRRPAVGHDASEAVGHLPEADLAGAGAVELAAPVALGDLGALVFGDHALHLDQQRGLRVGAQRRSLQEAHRHAEALELLEDQHLVGVCARESIGAQAHDPLEHAGLGGVAQPVERGAVEPRARVAVVDELLDDLVAGGFHHGAQRLELRGDRAALLLALGGDARVEADPHCPTVRKACPDATRPSRKP